jgi:hypothetical protein
VWVVMCYLSRAPEPTAVTLLDEISSWHVRFLRNICTNCGLSVSAKDTNQCSKYKSSSRFA